MTTSELIAHVGDDHIGVQNLDADSDGCTVSGGVGRFTLRTDPAYVHERALGSPAHIALVIWIPVDRLPEDFR